MKYYNLVIGEEKINFKVPENWNEVSFQKYVDYISLLDESVENGEEDNGGMYKKIYSLFTGLDESTWDMNLDVSVYGSIDSALTFLSMEPLCDRPTDIERNGKFYPISEDFLNLPLGKYMDINNFISEAHGEGKRKQLESVAKMIAVLACDSYNTEDELDEIAKDIMLMPSDVVNVIGGFFLQKFLESKNGTEMKPYQKSSHTNMNKLDMVRLVKISGFSTLFTVLLRVMLPSILKSWKLRFRKFIGLSNYRVVSMTQRKDILI